MAKANQSQAATLALKVLAAFPKILTQKPTTPVSLAVQTVTFPWLPGGGGGVS